MGEEGEPEEAADPDEDGAQGRGHQLEVDGLQEAPDKDARLKHHSNSSANWYEYYLALLNTYCMSKNS